MLLQANSRFQRKGARSQPQNPNSISGTCKHTADLKVLLMKCNSSICKGKDKFKLMMDLHRKICQVRLGESDNVKVNVTGMATFDGSLEMATRYARYF
jgi:hypothetical protein